MAKQGEPSIEEPLFCMRIRYWWYLILFFQMFLITFMISCLGCSRWVRQGELTTEWEGGLISVVTVSNIQDFVSWKDELYTDLAEDYCSKSSDLSKGLCKTFEDLAEASGSFIFYEFLTIVFTIVWMARVVLSLLERGMIVEWLAFIWPGLGLLCHIIGLSIWSTVSGATHSDDCEDYNDGDDRGKVCATSGPVMAIFIAFMYAGVAGLFVFLYIKRKKLSVN